MPGDYADDPGLDEGGVCSEGITREGLGASGEVCRWTAFQAVPILRNTIVILPLALSGVPWKVCD